MAATLTTILADIRTVTDHDSDTQITDAQLTSLVNHEYSDLRRRVSEIAPDLYTTTVDFTIASETVNYWTIAPTDFLKIRKVCRVEGAYPYPIPVASFLMEDTSMRISYRQQGTKIYIFPAQAAPGTYRLYYIQSAVDLTGSATVLLPDGAECVLVEHVAGRVRMRFEEDPTPHFRLAEAQWKDFRNDLMNMYQGSPRSTTDVSGFYA